MAIKQYKVEVELFVTMGVGKKKNYYLNLNSYRNWNFHLSNAIKAKFKKNVGKQEDFKALPRLKKCKLFYKIFYKTRRKFDVDNIGSVAGKFFQDTMVAAEKIQDDNYTYIPEITYSFGGVDKLNPRVEIYIVEVQ